MVAETQTTIFVSYTQQDSKWLQRLQVHLTPLTREGTVELWDNTKIKPGERSREQLEAALKRARVAILLVSADFLASEFIATNELPPLLDAADQQGVRIMSLIVGPCMYLEHPRLRRYQPINAPSQPLSGMPRPQAETVLLEVARTLSGYVENPPPPACRMATREGSHRFSARAIALFLIMAALAGGAVAIQNFLSDAYPPAGSCQCLVEDRQLAKCTVERDAKGEYSLYFAAVEDGTDGVIHRFAGPIKVNVGTLDVALVNELRLDGKNSRITAAGTLRLTGKGRDHWRGRWTLDHGVAKAFSMRCSSP